MNDSVYVALVEVRPLSGCEMDPNEVNGAITRCYVCAESVHQAVGRVEDALKADLFRVVEFEWCVSDEATEWEDPDDPTAREMIAEARKPGDVVYGTFHYWGHEAPDATDY